MKILGVITLYHPNVEIVSHNLSTYLPHLDGAVLWDNTPGEHCLPSLLTNQLQSCKTQIITHVNGTNEYIAPAINFAWKYAIDHAYDAVLIMDQDSSWTNFLDFRQQVDHLYNTRIDYGAFCPKVDKVYTWPTTSAIQPIRLFINSGTIIPTRVLTAIHGADTRFPLDALDNDLSIRIHQAGFTPVCLTDFHLCHELGHPMRSKILHLYSSNYNALRTYSIMRSYTLFLRIHHRWLNRSEIYTIIKEYFFWKPIRIALIEPDKWQRTKSYFRGIIDGLNIKI